MKNHEKSRDKSSQHNQKSRQVRQHNNQQSNFSRQVITKMPTISVPEVFPNCHNPEWRQHLLLYNEKIRELRGSGAGANSRRQRLIVECGQLWIDKDGSIYNHLTQKFPTGLAAYDFVEKKLVNKKRRYGLKKKKTPTPNNPPKPGSPTLNQNENQVFTSIPTSIPVVFRLTKHPRLLQLQLELICLEV